MKKTINGQLYDTERALLIGSHSYGNPRDFAHYSESLYQKESGELFLYGEGGPQSEYMVYCGNHTWSGGEDIIPSYKFDVKKWVADHCDVDTYIKLFGPVEE